MPIIECECGEKILLVPDLNEMVKSIESHAAVHEKKHTDAQKAKAESCRIQDLLIEQVFKIIT
jgi:hypothetical protein